MGVVGGIYFVQLIICLMYYIRNVKCVVDFYQFVVGNYYFVVVGGGCQYQQNGCCVVVYDIGIFCVGDLVQQIGNGVIVMVVFGVVEIIFECYWCVYCVGNCFYG